MSIGKYLTNLGVIGAILGVLGTVKQTRQMPNDWRRFVVWGVWAAGLALALGGVAKQPEDEAFEAEQQAELQQQKKLAKQRKKLAK